MSLRDDLAGVLARDSRYSIQAYAFVLEALEYTKNAEASAAAGQARGTAARSRRRATQHVTGRELCEGARRPGPGPVRPAWP